MVCSCAMSSNCVWLQIIICSCVNETRLFSFLWSFLREKKGRSLRFPKIIIRKQTWWSNDKTIIMFYRDLSVSRISIICLSVRLRQIIDLLATDKSRYFAQPRPIIISHWPTKAKYYYNCNKKAITYSVQTEISSWCHFHKNFLLRNCIHQRHFYGY